MGHSAGVGRVWAICFSDADFDRSGTVLSRGNECCIGLRRRTLFYLLVSASIALTSVDAFSNPAHKQAASHPSKAVKAENHKHRVGAQASHRGKTAKTENHKHQSQTEAKHSERALGPRILLPRDPTSAADSTPATQLAPEFAASQRSWMPLLIISLIPWTGRSPRSIASSKENGDHPFAVRPKGTASTKLCYEFCRAGEVRFGHEIPHELLRLFSGGRISDCTPDRSGVLVLINIEPLEIEQWLKALKQEEDLANPTLDKIRRVMSLVYKHGQRYGLIPRTQEANPIVVRCKTTSGYEAMILTPKQAFDVLMHLQEPERTLTLLASATGLRISECLGLQWHDVNFEHSQIHVRRTWTCGQVGGRREEQSFARSGAATSFAGRVHAGMEEHDLSSPNPGDWVFASFKCKWKQPRVANMLVESHLRPAAVKAGVLGKDEKVRFGFHNLRHSLASFLVRTKTDPKTVQALLRHSDVKTTLQLYAHSISEDRMAAQGQMLEDILQSSSEAVN